MDLNDAVEVTRVAMTPDGRMTAKAAATYLGLSEKTLAQKRCNGRGPRFLKKGRIFYYRKDLDSWLEEGRATSTAQVQSRQG